MKLLDVRHLEKSFPVREGLLQRVVAKVKAVDDVSFTIDAGETLPPSSHRGFPLT